MDPESKKLKRHLVARYLNFRTRAGKTDSKKVEFSNISVVTSRNHMLLREKHLLKRLSSHEDRHLALPLEHECVPFLNSCLDVSRSVDTRVYSVVLSIKSQTNSEGLSLAG